MASRVAIRYLISGYNKNGTNELVQKETRTIQTSYFALS